MRAVILGAACALLASPALAAGAADVSSVVNKYAQAITAGDRNAPAMCATSAVVIDDFAPHVWQGAGACAKWQMALGAMMKQNGMSGAKVSLGKPTSLQVNGDDAYGVYPAVFSYVQKGKAQSEKGAWTFAMKKTSGAWRLTGWAWGTQ
jgi:hypothetical protein